MEYVPEPQKQIPVVRDVEVAVVGAGCAGVFAAIAAAKEGARTILIDRLGIVGGNAGPGMIIGCVDPFLEGERQILGGNKGLVKDAEQRVGALMASRPEARPVYSALFSGVVAKMLEENGVDLMLSARAGDPIVEDGVVKGVFVETASGRVAVKCRILIDATAEAGMARRAGASIIRYSKAEPSYEAVIGRRNNQSLYDNWNEVGLIFLIGGVDWKTYFQWIEGSEAVPVEGLPHIEPNGLVDEQLGQTGGPSLRYPSKLVPLLKKAWEEGSYRFARELAPRRGLFWTSNMSYRETGFFPLGQDVVEASAMVFGDVNVDDWEDVSQLEHEMRLHAFDTVEFFRWNVPGFEKSFLLMTAPFIGARGGPFIDGEYLVTPEDIRTGVRHDDVVLRSIWEVPKLEKSGKGTTQALEGYDIPFRMMQPKGLDNILVVGRGSSYIRRGHDPATRARVTQFNLGQAAGITAALAVGAQINVRDFNVKILQRKLLELGYYLGDEERLKILDLA